ncbi:L-lactate dehydrogenase complex protein LldG [Flavobacterium sp. 90]|uniref:LutC/YkgG family protein n=1 Tax=unclassified Flavobacterium TaxID=196869 RepID=UPI000EADF417|nr:MULTISPECIES: LUD domain-containing protein [unclassified Flavobacterium]RKR12079.1 L-lactate dehydrogenase complex protein LldG [Flavobacterium sp. 81]TCK55851.1 L-lactate dehydrogenase complex protein LldG [Flavobacterium sp. 90]
MSARENILNAIAMNQPELVELPVIDLNSVIHYEDAFAQFKTVLESIGGKVELISDIAVLKDQLIADKTSGSFIVNTIAALGDIDEQVAFLSAIELEKVEKAYIKGTIGVAENGAVWVYESQMINRLIPFICQHLILVIEKKNIVNTLHQAYEKIEVSKEGFGAFIAGPSKTADIEQSLVIGAHGARSAVIYVIE